MSVHQNFGFPPGYFVIRSTSCNRLLDVSLDDADDGAEIILWPEKESSLVESAISICDFSNLPCSQLATLSVPPTNS